MRLENKVAIITGAASGMGQAEAQLFAREGAKVVVADLNLEAAEETVKSITDEGGEAIAVKVDVTKTDELENLVKEATDTYGQIDILVNNAGLFDKYATSLDTTKDQWEFIFAINITAPFELTNLVLPGMIERGMGSIVNIASVAGMVAGKGGAAYTSSKHAMMGYTKHLASVYGKDGIKINAICPGTISTPLIKDVVANIPTDPIPVKRIGEAHEVAELALFLASDEGNFLQGALIPIDGGFTIQ